MIIIFGQPGNLEPGTGWYCQLVHLENWNKRIFHMIMQFTLMHPQNLSILKQMACQHLNVKVDSPKLDVGQKKSNKNVKLLKQLYSC